VSCVAYFSKTVTILLLISDTLSGDIFDHTRILVIHDIAIRVGEEYAWSLELLRESLRHQEDNNMCISHDKQTTVCIWNSFSFRIRHKTIRMILECDQIIIRILFYSPELYPTVYYWTYHIIVPFQCSTYGQCLLFLLLFEFTSFFLKNLAFWRSLVVTPV
jgi:hypothetical protein